MYIGSMQLQNEQVLDQWSAVKKNFAQSISKMFPINGKKNILEIGEISYDESKANLGDLRSQEQAKHAEKTWGVPVYAEFILKDKLTGQVINKSKQKIADMPKLTQRETYIVGGGEYNSAYQWRLKSGIYSKIKENGQYETEFNLNGAGKDFAKEQRLKIPFDPETKQFKLKYATVAIPLYSALKADDVSDEKIKETLGEDIFKANFRKNWQADIAKLYNAKLKKRGVIATSESFEDIKKAFQKELHKAEVLPETTKLTLGKEYKELSGDVLLHGADHIRQVTRGKKPDDVYSLYFKHLLGLDDFIGEKFGDSKTALKIKSKIRNNLDRKDAVSQIIGKDLFTKPLGQVFYGNALSQRPDQTNPLDMLSASNLTTIKGPGGISSEHAIRNSMKIVNQSHVGFLDPILSPECVSPDTSILCFEGWKLVPEITMKDKVACNINGKLEFHNPTKVHEYPYSGTMYGSKHPKIKYLVTHNHRMWIKDVDIWQFKDASEAYANTFDVLTEDMQSESLDKVSYHYKEKYKGNVYCVTVPGGLVLIKKDDGIGFWCGNSTETGISLHLPLGVKKVGREARALVFNIQEQKYEYVNPAQLHGEFTVSPDQIKIKDGKPVPRKEIVTVLDPKTHEFVQKPYTEAKYVLPSPRNLFSEATNLIPFLQCNQGNRTMTGSRQPSQGVPLAHREQPLVQVQSNGSASYESLYGKKFAHQSPVDGKVVDISKDELGHTNAIHVKGNDNKNYQIQVYNHFPLNDKKSFLHADPIVKIGDEVKKGQTLADSNFTKNGTLSIGTNLRTGYFNYGSGTYEDSVVISEAASKKLSSEHLHKISIDIDPTSDKVSLNKFLTHISSVGKKIKKDKLESLGEEGVIKPGTKVKPGDILIAAVTKNELDESVSMMSSRLKGAVAPYKDKSLVWDHDYEGEVKKVIPKSGGKGYTVYVKTVEPAQVGDKLCGRSGDKNIIGSILPDHEMPYVKNPDGTKSPIELITAPSGVVSRINIGQLLELGASKIALKTGKPYITNNFGGEKVDYAEKIRAEMKEHGLQDTDTVHDPVLGKDLDNKVLTGHKYIMKLKHQVEKKESVRGLDQAQAGKYSINLDPQRGKGQGAQAIAQLDLYALLAHGARQTLREMSSYKAELQHDPTNMAHTDADFWNRVMLGLPLPPPKPTFAYRKFEGYLTGLGLNLKKTGNETILTPLTDKGVLALSNGEVKDAQQVRGKDSKEIPGGLFDKQITGGIPNQVGKGLNWSHYTLAEPMPSPIFVGSQKLPGPAVVLSGLKHTEFEKVVKGEKAVTVNGKEMTGGSAIYNLLKNIDVKKELQNSITKLPTLSGAELNKENKKAKFLRALDKLNLRPEEAYMMNHVPIIPPIFRPMVQTPNGDVSQADITELYKHLIINNNRLKDPDMKKLPGQEEQLRAAVWDNLKAVTGLGKVPTYDGNRKYKGLLQQIAGDSPKTGFFQHKVMKKRQELSMRSTVIPGPDMGIDQVGLPKNSAMELYKPFVVRELVRAGKDLIEAKKEVKEGTPMAWRALEKAVQERPVLVKRDPVLHKYNIQALKPILIEGKAISMHPLNCAAYNLDHDGDHNLHLILLYISNQTLDTLLKVPPKSWNNTPEEINKDFWEQRRVPMTARFNSIIPVGAPDGNFYIFHLQDFPHREMVGKSAQGAEFYAVPDDLCVVAYDAYSLEPKLAKVANYSIHRDKEVVITTLSSGKQIVADDDPRAVYGFDPIQKIFARWRPSDSIGKMVPVVKDIEFPVLQNVLNITCPNPRVKKQVPLTELTGYALGAIVGDGWVDARATCLSNNSILVTEKWTTGMKEFIPDVNVVTVESTHRPFGLDKDVSHKRHAINCEGFQQVVGGWVGKGAGNKRLPPFTFTAPREFRLGVLAGLIDTDGSMSISHGKAKPQFLCNYTTKSIRLAKEIVLLCRTLGIQATITKTYTPKGDDFYSLNLSSSDLFNTELGIVHEDRQAAWNYLKFESDPQNAATSIARDLIPINRTQVDILTKIGSIVDKALYMSIRQSKDRGYITRRASERALALLEGKLSPEQLTELQPFLGMVRNRNVTWEHVVSFENTGIVETGYDLTVPGLETFMDVDGIICSNTTAVYLPLTETARQEALDKMLPSKNLFSSTNYGIMHAPDHESIIGLNMLSKWGTSSGAKFSSLEDLKKSNKPLDEVVKVKFGNEEKETTKGRALLAEYVPDKFKEDLLHNSSINLKKSSIHNLLEDYARHSPKDYPRLVDDWRKKGAHTAHSAGFSFSLNDLKPLKEKRDAILKPYHEEAAKIRAGNGPVEEQDKKIVDLYNEATIKLDKELSKDFAAQGNNMFKMVDTKARGSMAQFRQTVIAPMLMVDSTNKVVPTPVTKSYSEGLSVAEYWTTLHGARKGTLQRVAGTATPGAMAKEIVNLNVTTPVVKEDCGTTNVTHINFLDKNGNSEEDVVGRYINLDVKTPTRTFPKGTLVTPEIFNLMKEHNEHAPVRSALTCIAPQGICAKCFGRNENDRDHEIGTNIGAIASHALSEPATQLSMDCVLGISKITIKKEDEVKEITIEDLWNEN